MAPRKRGQARNEFSRKRVKWLLGLSSSEREEYFASLPPGERTKWYNSFSARDVFELSVSKMREVVWLERGWAAANGGVIADGYRDTVRGLGEALDDSAQRLREIAGADETAFRAFTFALNTAFHLGEILRGELPADRERYSRTGAASAGRTAKREEWQTRAAELAEPLLEKHLSASRITDLVFPKLNGRIGKTALRHFIGQQKKVGRYDRKRQESR
jgi:hypothetical protein